MSRCWIKAVTGLVMGLGLTLNISAAPLSPEHEVRRLVMAVDTAITESRWDDASRYLARLQTLDSPKPAEFQFFRGKVMLQASQLNEAQAALEAYVNQASADGQYYDQALQLITQVEDRQLSRPEEREAKPVATIEPAQRVDTKALQSLYLEDSEQGALIAHLNSLLSLNAWQPGPIIRNKPSEGVRYQLDVGADKTLQVQEAILDHEDGPILRASSLSVFGINPAVSHACFESDNSCWLYDPRDNSRWLRLANRPEPAAETARMLSELIRNLQKGS